MIPPTFPFVTQIPRSVIKLRLWKIRIELYINIYIYLYIIKFELEGDKGPAVLPIVIGLHSIGQVGKGTNGSKDYPT